MQKLKISEALGRECLECQNPIIQSKYCTEKTISRVFIRSDGERQGVLLLTLSLPPLGEHRCAAAVQAGDSQDKQEWAGAGAAGQPASMWEGAPVRKHPGLWHRCETFSPSGGQSTDKDRFSRPMDREVFVPDPAEGRAGALNGAGAARAGRARRWGESRQKRAGAVVPAGAKGFP